MGGRPNCRNKAAFLNSSTERSVDGVRVKCVFFFFFIPRNLCRIDIPTTHILIAEQRNISKLDYLPGSPSLSAR